MPPKRNTRIDRSPRIAASTVLPTGWGATAGHDGYGPPWPAHPPDGLTVMNAHDTTATRLRDPWGRPATPQTTGHSRNIITRGQLGWSREEAARVRDSLMSFADDWDDPAMDVYDEL